MVINKALLKYGYSQFNLDILEYCEAKDLIKKEQYYINNLKPEYNVLKTAYSSLGYKHTKESKLKISMANKGKKRSEEFKKMASAILKGGKKSKDTIEKMRKAN